MDNFCKIKSKRDMCPILIESKDLLNALLILIRNIDYTIFLRNIYSGMIFLFAFYSKGVPLYHDAQNLWNGLIRVKLYETISIGKKIMAEKFMFSATKWVLFQYALYGS